jgi:DNA-binding transcriptional ArsR family regulator
MPNKKESKSKTSYTNYKTDMHLLGKVLASPNKKKILYSLSMPMTPKEISKKTDLNFPTVSKNIKDLEELGIIKVENKDLKKGKVIVMEERGKTIVYDLEKRKNEKKQEK